MTDRIAAEPRPASASQRATALETVLKTHGILPDGFVEEFNDIDGKLDAAKKAFSNARHRLTDSDQSVTARAKRLVEAGAKGKRSLATEITPVIEPLTPLIGSDEEGEPD